MDRYYWGAVQAAAARVADAIRRGNPPARGLVSGVVEVVLPPVGGVAQLQVRLDGVSRVVVNPVPTTPVVGGVAHCRQLEGGQWVVEATAYQVTA